MRFISTLIICTLSFLYSHSQIIQFGVIREINSNGRPIAGVGISVLTATDLQPVASNSNGTFQLVFSEKKPGDVIYNIKITKSDYEIVNIHDFKNGWKLSTQDTMKIIIAPKGTVEQLRLQYYNIFYNYQEKEYKHAIDSLKKALKNQTISLDEYRKNVVSIESELQNANNRIEEYANFFARINKDDLDSLSTNALFLLEQGKLDEAIRIFEQQNLLLELENKVLIRNQSTESISILIPKLQEEVQYRQLVMGETNIRKIDEILKNIALSDTSNFQYLYDYAMFLSKQVNMDLAIFWGEKALNHAKSSENKCDILHLLGHHYYQLHNYEMSKYYLEKSLVECEKLKEIDYDLYLRKITLSKNTLANIYLDQHDFTKAEQLLIENAQIRKQLYEKNPNNFKYYAIGLNNLGELFSAKFKIDLDSIVFEKAIMCYDEAINIRRSIDKNQIDNKASIATLYNNKGSLYISAQLFDLANENFQKSLENWEYLVKINPQKYKEDIISCIVNLGVLNSNLKQFQKAQEFFTRGLMYCNESLEDNPQLFGFLKAKILQNQGRLYRRMDQNDNAEKSYLEAIVLYRNIEKDCSQSVADVYNNLGVLHLSQNQFDKAVMYMKNAREQMECLMQKSPDAFKFKYAVYTYNIAYFYFKANDKKNGMPEYKKAKKLFQKLEKQYPDKCKSFLKDIEEESEQLRKMKKCKD